MSGNRPIFWYEGTFLRPQHFQQQDLFHQTQLRDVRAITTPHPWGVSSLSILQSALNNQVFEVEQCELVFPDAPAVRYPGNAHLGRKSFEDSWDASGKPLAVYIGLKRLFPGRSNVSAAAKEDGTEPKDTGGINANRYRALENPTPTYDLYADDQQEPISFLDYHLQVFFEDEIEQAVDFDLIKVGEIERSGSEVRLSDRFIPPLMRVEASPQLARMVRNAKELLTTRGRDLALYKGAKGMAAEEFSARDMVYLLALNTLNRYIPELHHLTEQSAAHPWIIYGVLRRIVGELSTFSTRFDVFGKLDEEPEGIGMPEYQHEDLAGCFGRAGEILLNLLDELTAGPDYVSTLHFDGTYFYSDVGERVFKGNNKYYLSVRSELPAEGVVAMMQTIAKLGAKEHLPILMARSLPGVPLEYLPAPPTVLPRRVNTIYFQLDAQGQAWDAVRDGLNVAIYMDNPPAETEMQLLVVYGK